MKYSNNWLIEQLQNNQEINYIYFWGHHPAKNGATNQSCLSQWFDSPFEYEGNVYRTAEHWMMAEKARLFKDAESEQLILKSTSPKEAKALGRQVKNFDNNAWLAERVRIVTEGNALKFTQNKDMGKYLLSTGNDVLVEASPYDRIWGIGMKKDDRGVDDPRNWKGGNLLGYVLMEVRGMVKAN
ncbi:MAG: NADAR family protein [Saprospiraceae bacterium]